jgi:PAS domain S-box-containing protein
MSGADEPDAAATRRLAAIVESSDDAIIGKTLDGIVTSWNRAAERIFGYTAAEMLGQPIALLAAPGKADEMPRILDRIRRGDRIDHYETARRHKDGRIIDRPHRGRLEDRA